MATDPREVERLSRKCRDAYNCINNKTAQNALIYASDMLRALGAENAALREKLEAVIVIVREECGKEREVRLGDRIVDRLEALAAQAGGRDE